LLIAHKPGAFTTVGISTSPAEAREKHSSCAERIHHLPPGSFALFVMDFEEPIVLKNQPKIVIGRDTQMLNTATTLDLSRYGDLALGISRHHAQIHYADEIYSVEDLGSTNGTWLNRRRLNPGQTYPLHNDDQLWLGPLKMLFCFAPTKPDEQTTFLLRPANTLLAQEQNLTPDLLQEEIGPYLQAIVRLEEARAACLELPSQPIYITSIQESASQIAIQLDGAGEALALIEKWVVRWRDEHLEMVGMPKPKQAYDGLEQLAPLANHIIASLQPAITDEKSAQSVTQFLPPLTVLVTSSLEFSF
jgi:pSer/pThr/pTyr-binding forkhead associated (FHA) protein